MFFSRLLTCLFVTVLATEASAQEKSRSYYLIGNSLTWDTVPSKLDGKVQWHVDCGKSLPWMYDNPEKPCVKNSTLWPTALKSKQYDYISFQPHYGSTLKSDLETISKWMAVQKKAIIVIHTGWARSKSRAVEFSDQKQTDRMLHSPHYFRSLIDAIKKEHPTRAIRQTNAIQLLDQIAMDAKSGTCPFDSVEELYRDAIHMKLDSGRYLMHNAMRLALGQPISDNGFKNVNPDVKKYLDSVLTKVITK